ncbi:HAD-IA family hydrolase [Kitasatospora sp. NBC_01287]|uniref:HAD-IA family hydrolase n=1 Tax=Kitasatospora sp. NBC_01287 TaxID=2903573 RepID=UPI00224DEF8F|nr:HAD-IA family hydrolase [Kitasatospora sp. NBC_01287]MCX4744357.1 HAD-IA family hydrolase [Kitasatospora sp. NBC_01287]
MIFPTPFPFAAVLCDLDNVVRFFDHTELARLELAAGLSAGSTAAVAFAPEHDGPLLLGEITKEQWVEAIARALAARVPADQARALATAFGSAPFRADPEVVGLLRAVRAHCPVVLVTNATAWLEQDLDLLGLLDLADHVVNSSRVGVAKPDPRIYKIAAERAGAEPGRCLFVDDRAENVEAAIALGMAGVVYREPADLRAAFGVTRGVVGASD